MIRVLILLIVLYACNSKTHKPTISNIEGKVKDFIQKEYVPKMNDPKSYEFVGMPNDTINGEMYVLLQSMKYFDDKSLSSAEALKINDSIKAHPTKKDSIICYDAHVSLRGKNGYGAVMLSKETVRVFNDGKMEIVTKISE